MARTSKANMEAFQVWLKDEINHPGKRAANIKLARALGVFLGSVFVFRAYGEALFAA
eukprot:CAMPEP_0202868870 /NCGR_PEP_ID=MMETSP1391-20130828/11276_1 /ASSEMBLY_ACC=CAM_ASM_000867 /TAXON_ID=1034604 /ORGANISM="Chlamydomonas leiostraca, Strain SAG 11-49" /LENGTH=56 /DNA_ID=CAMNT_0049549087 /DNA_START=73 /DNA_END=243 /DNA_ORIENTATION=+